MALSKLIHPTFGGVTYWVHPQLVGNIVPKAPVDTTLQPSVVVSSSSGNFSADSILDTITTFAHADDVWSESFKASLILQTTSGNEDVSALEQLRSSLQFKSVHMSRAGSAEKLLPSGPYFLQGQNIHQAWRLYPDELDAFIVTVVPTEVSSPTTFSVLDAMSPEGIWRQVAVPSRMYAKPTVNQPLAGARIGLKDNYHLAGVKTTMMSRAYTELYGPETENADYVKKLLSLGAVIVGKTKMCAFASSDEPTDQWIDFTCPTNPRGDRYQSPSGSSTGAAAALAGYPWLDYSLGADTAGSIRAPATCNGLFSLRPSFNVTSMKGIQASCPNFDVVGILSRQLQSIHHIAAATLDLEDGERYPSKILYPTDFFPHSNKNQQAMVEEFVCVLENFLGTKRTMFSFADRWNKCPPVAAKGKPIKEYLAKSAFWPMCYDYYHAFDQFRSDYRDKFGKNPYASPVTQFRWDVGRRVSQEEYEQGWAELKVFRDWFDGNVLSSHPETRSDAIMIMPYGMGRPKYRDSPNEKPSTSGGFAERFISPALEIPQLVVPIGQNPYESRITENLEYRPIASTILGARGSDLMLVNLAKAALESASWPTEIMTGRFMFKLGDNVRNVADQRSGRSEPM